MRNTIFGFHVTTIIYENRIIPKTRTHSPPHNIDWSLPIFKDQTPANLTLTIYRNDRSLQYLSITWSAQCAERIRSEIENASNDWIRKARVIVTLMSTLVCSSKNTWLPLNGQFKVIPIVIRESIITTTMNSEDSITFGSATLSCNTIIFLKV